MEAKLYNAQGKESGTISLPETVFGVKWNANLVHQVITAMQANARTPIAHAKDRSEVAGTTKKPWKQKGTGSARAGSRRSPIWRGGGVTHGPRSERTFKQKINKKTRVKALYTILTKKFMDNEILFLDSITFDAPKTKDAKMSLLSLSKIDGFDKLATKRKNAALIVQNKLDTNVEKSFRNFGNILLGDVKSMSPVDVLKYKYLVLVGGDEAVKLIEGRKKTTKTK